jgi:hypothetical protein
MNAKPTYLTLAQVIDYGTALQRFIADRCVGRQYDSCVTSPCRYAGSDGCQHPEHPKHQRGAA